MRKRYFIRPLDGGMMSDYANLHAPPGSIVYPAKNIRIEQHSSFKRWGYAEDSGSRELVRGLVSRLRAKVEPDPRQPRFIRTVPGVGYAFEAG